MYLNFLKKRKAFTLTELVLVMLIVSIFGFSIFMFLHYSVNMQARQSDEVLFQESIRDSMLTIEDKIKKSNSVFAIPQKDFLGTDGKPLDRKWIYIGVADKGPNAGQICMFECQNPNELSPPVWEETVLSSNKGGLKYRALFKKTGAKGVAQKKLEYTVTAISEEGFERSMSSATEVLNVVSVVDRGTEDLPATVIAIRNGDVDFKVVPSLTFVVDVSMSMEEKFEGGTAADESEKRIEAARKSLITMVDAIRDQGLKVDLMFVDFIQFGDTLLYKEGSDDWEYGNLLDDYDDVKNMLQTKFRSMRNTYADPNYSSVPVNKKRSGGTNIGDGLRIGYVSIKKNLALKTPIEDKSRFLILLTDGEPNLYTHQKGKNGQFGVSLKYYFGDKFAKDVCKEDGCNAACWGKCKGACRGGCKCRSCNCHISPDYTTYSAKYPCEIARRYSSGGVEAIPGIKSYVISIGNNSPKTIQIFKDINEAMGNPPSSYFDARREEDLYEAIANITADFIADAWTYNGPKRAK